MKTMYNHHKFPSQEEKFMNIICKYINFEFTGRIYKFLIYRANKRWVSDSILDNYLSSRSIQNDYLLPRCRLIWIYSYSELCFLPVYIDKIFRFSAGFSLFLSFVNSVSF